MTNPQNPSQNNPYANAAMAYGTAQKGEMSGFEVTAELYKGMIRFVGQAKNSYKSGRLDDMVVTIQKVNKILVALQSNLNFEDGAKEASVFLNDLYMEVFKRLTFVLRVDDTEKEFDDIRGLLEPVAKMWVAHAENAKKATPDTHIDVPAIGDASDANS